MWARWKPWLRWQFLCPTRLRDAHVCCLTQGPQKLCKIEGKQPTNDTTKWEEAFQGPRAPCQKGPEWLIANGTDGSAFFPNDHVQRAQKACSQPTSPVSPPGHPTQPQAWPEYGNPNPLSGKLPNSWLPQFKVTLFPNGMLVTGNRRCGSSPRRVNNSQ